MQQQHFHQDAGAGAVTERLAGRGPERLVRRGERPGRAGLDQGGGAGQRAGLARQDLQVVVQVQHLHAPARRPLVPGHHRSPVVNGDGRSGEFHADPVADEPGRHAVLVAADRDLRIPVRPRGEGQRGVERLGRQRPQQLPFERPVVPDAARPAGDAAPVIGVIPGLEQDVELIDRVDGGHRDAVSAAEPAALAFHAALLVAALMAGLAVERVEAVVRPERRPPVRLHPAAAEQHPRHRGLEVVIADLHQRHAAEPPERMHVGFQERLLALRQRRPVRGPARIRQPHREQRGLGLHPGQDHPQVVEVHLGLGRRRMRLRHAPRLQRPARLSSDLRPPPGHVVAHRRVGQILPALLVYQPGQHPPGGMPLLLRRVQVRPQHAVDRRRKRRQPRRHPGRCLARRRHRAGQCLPHRPPVHVIPVGQLPDRAILDPRITPDLCEQLHLRPQPSGPFRDHQSDGDHDQAGDTSNRHNQPGVSATGARSDRHNNNDPPSRRGHFRPSRWGQIRLSWPSGCFAGSVFASGSARPDAWQPRPVRRPQRAARGHSACRRLCGSRRGCSQKSRGRR